VKEPHTEEFYQAVSAALNRELDLDTEEGKRLAFELSEIMLVCRRFDSLVQRWVDELEMEGKSIRFLAECTDLGSEIGIHLPDHLQNAHRIIKEIDSRVWRHLMSSGMTDDDISRAMSQIFERKYGFNRHNK